MQVPTLLLCARIQLFAPYPSAEVLQTHILPMDPLLKWAGGKRKLAEAIVAHTGRQFNRYVEPFLGGAAMLLHLAPPHAICSDINVELVNFYQVVQHQVDELWHEININYLPHHAEEFFYHVRKMDRDPRTMDAMTPMQRAARFVYLNKTCYNGLWRVNRHGQNNAPWGKYQHPTILDEANLMAVHQYLSENDVKILQADYAVTARLAEAGDFVYFDPPYDDEKQAGFVGYSAGGFTRANQADLRALCDELVDRGVHVAVSNADTPFIRQLYADERYRIYDDLRARRNIGANAERRGVVCELLIEGGRGA